MNHYELKKSRIDYIERNNMADNVGAAGFSTIPVKTNVIVISLGSLTQRVLAASLKDAHVIALTSKGPTADALSSKFAGDNLILFNVEINKQMYTELHKKFHRVFVVVPPRVSKTPSTLTTSDTLATSGEPNTIEATSTTDTSSKQENNEKPELPQCCDDVTLIEYATMNKIHFPLRGGLLPFIILWESAILLQFGDKCMEFVANCTLESSIRLFKSIEDDLVRKVEEIFSCGSRAIEKIEEHVTRGEMLYQNEIENVKAYLRTGKLISLTFEAPSEQSSTLSTSDEPNNDETTEKTANEGDAATANEGAAVELSSVAEVKILALYDNIIDTVVVSLGNIAKLSHADVILLFATNFFKTGEQTCRINTVKPLTSIGAEYAKQKKPDEIMSDLSAYFREKAEQAKEIVFIDAKKDSEKQ